MKKKIKNCGVEFGLDKAFDLVDNGSYKPVLWRGLTWWGL